MKLKQLEPVVETVGDYKFYITPFPALKAANMTGELASLMLPLFGALAPLVKDGDSEKKENGLMDIDAGKAAAAIASSVTIDGNKMEKLIQKFLLGGHITVELEDDDGEPEGCRLDMDLLNEIFCGEVQDMFILCFYVIRINFSGFFGKLAGLSGKAGAALEMVQKKARQII
ncbi:hypothetical protein C823_005226 [Eubacterium plexicaudatum ASF492]|uniref:Uncharacterized protein n=1 Tax=Eubacterium plexicaudatum ASF492 TaxID=1235802 RepID=N2B8K1_9FIRM|nr:hypothetical protein C823_005226 [Eubacterium plexicaudatum ASF492]